MRCEDVRGCEAFRHRMHQRLDARLPLEHDERLRRHAEGCAACRDELQAWQQIAAVLPGHRPALTGSLAPPRGGWRRPARRVAIGLAASVIVLWALRPAEPLRRPSLTPPPPAAAPAELALTYPAPPAEAEPWWDRVREQPWLDSAIPAVRSVGEGVAPLGRSLLQAVAILAHGQGTGTS